MYSSLITEKFHSFFQSSPELIVRSPGRINLIGEHTDYNGGFVLPASIDKELYFAIRKKEGSDCRIFAENLDEHDEFSIDNLEKTGKEWANYLKGVVDQLQKAGYKIGGFDLVFGGNIPTGAGVSSSAALECGLAFCLNQLYDLNLDTLTMVKLSQKAENEFVGVNCGIMDQFASMFGKQSSVIQIDCRSLNYQYFPFEMEDFILILCNTGVKHSLGNSEYNTRRQECETGVQILQKYYPEIKTLRDVSMEMLGKHETEFPEIVLKRCKYVVEEIVRVQEACKDLTENNMRAFGQKMYQTHFGLQHDYAVSCEELDYLVEQTLEDENVFGARMMGGGFGGCTINLVKKDGVDRFLASISEAYQQKFNIELVSHLVTITDGTSVLSH
ncbi:galactokinase [Pseudarcicella hirudinis]|uniref:Galactokinase n=1 Tax=Pseudarcicella hirudinis TaxID=1079859 RepID=A0A1I5Z337_9BACT|nr:galactokinase [Pseudarcicella hirudinis]SFQ50871.1 galactokinase [Pseudarcicella hirudinis]